ncbi:hypothetical protein ON010_g8175 [Phytophthora cinnamomi]|nr:hypothetical protein ON010_g8175 [Phytophthora cinnamomi]
MKVPVAEGSGENAGGCSLGGLALVPQLDLSVLHDVKFSKADLAQARQLSSEDKASSLLPPVYAYTARELRDEDHKPETGGNQTVRIRFAPPPRLIQKASVHSTRPTRARHVGPNVAVCELPTGLREKQLNTARCFKALQNWQQSMEAGVLKNLLGDSHEVLHAAIYRQPEAASDLETIVPGTAAATELPPNYPNQSVEEVEYFSLVADMQEKVKLQQQERKRLSTQLAMEQSLEQDLSSQLRQLERELTQLHMRHAHNRAEIEGERRAVQILERDYASLTEQEQELQRDCEVFELQLDTQRAQLREIRSQHALEVALH